MTLLWPERSAVVTSSLEKVCVPALHVHCHVAFRLCLVNDHAIRDLAHDLQTKGRNDARKSSNPDRESGKQHWCIRTPHSRGQNQPFVKSTYAYTPTKRSYVGSTSSYTPDSHIHHTGTVCEGHLHIYTNGFQTSASRHTCATQSTHRATSTLRS